MENSKSILNPPLRAAVNPSSWQERRKRLSDTLRRDPPDFFPLKKFLAGYRMRDAKADTVAGLNVALLDFPQGMAYALIAGLPFTMGIYASAVAALLGPIMASSRFIMLGPTNAIAVLTLSTFLGIGLSQAEAVAAMPLLLIMVSALMLVGGFLKVASLVDYVSRTVITGYVHAAALLIVAKQLKNALGLELPPTATFLDSAYQTAARIGQTQLPSLAIAAATVAISLALRLKLRRLPDVAITLVAMYFACDAAEQWLGWEFARLGDHLPDAGLLPLSLPTWDFELFRKLAHPALAIAFLSLLESASIAKTLAAKSGETVNVNQQMLSMGIANLGCSFFSGMPISGSLTRSSLNERSGAKTPVSSIVSALSLIVGFAFLAQYMVRIPLPALSSLVILVGLSLVNRENLKIAFGTTRSDTIVFWVTFVTGLALALDTAIYAGVITSVLLFMRKAGAPVMKEIAFDEYGCEREAAEYRPGLAMLHVEGDLFFGSSDLFLEQARVITRDPNLRVIILRLRNARNLDATCAMAIGQLVHYARSLGRHVLVCGAHPEVVAILRNSGLLKTLGPENIFVEDAENPTLSNSEALHRARQLVGQNLEVRLFLTESDAR